MLHNIYDKFPSFLAPPFAAAIGALFLLLLVTVASTAQPALTVGTTVWLQGPADAIHLGDTITVTIRIGDVVDLYGAQVALSFDPDDLQVVDADPAEPGVQITPAECPAPDLLVQNQADNAAGTIGYAVTQLNPTPPVSGDCSMALIQFQTQQVTTALLAFGEVILADRDGTAIAHSVLGLTINILDDEPPTGSILVNGGDSHTNHPTVDLTLAAIDNVGVTGMRLYYDGSWGDWETYADAKTLTLAGIDGTRVISVEYRDAAGNTSSAYSDTITLDTTPPTSAVEALPALQDDISLTVSWSGADATSDILCYDIQYRDGADGEWTDWQICVTDLSAAFAGTAGRTYYFRSRAQDPAGNWESYPIDPDGDTHTTLRDPPYPPADPYKVFLPIILRQ